MQSENVVVILLLAMDWVEVVASVVRIIIVLKSVGHWRAMFIIDFYVSRYFLVFCVVTDVSYILPLLRFGLKYPGKQDLILKSR